MDIRLHRAQGQFQDAGDLLVTMPLDVPQQDARAILGPEAGDGVLDGAAQLARFELLQGGFTQDRKSTRLNSSHGYISYAVFCLKKKKNKNTQHQLTQPTTPDTGCNITSHHARLHNHVTYLHTTATRYPPNASHASQLGRPPPQR